MPGNAYNFGIQPAPWHPGVEHVAVTPKGRIRIEMEDTYRSAVAAGRVRVIVLRAGDFIDDDPEGTWLGDGILRKLASNRINYPGPFDVPHAWAYLPDLGRAASMLAEKRAELPPFTDIAFPGYTLTGRELSDAIAHVTGREPMLSRMSWWPLRMLAPFWSLAAGMVEMRYLWRHPHCFDAAAFEAELPDFEHTPVEVALSPLIGRLTNKSAHVHGNLISTQTSL
ncbi:epimerase [Algicella marina]|uniref:Epimerase n=1 Tax=Algicella marina TaxID=2683284 RepID=A0A6P1T779_9RHOB|nr:epimerase [Algicella marina]QHQ36432.1 epimerase [Algicella marina]